MICHIIEAEKIEQEEKEEKEAEHMFEAKLAHIAAADAAKPKICSTEMDFKCSQPGR